MICPLRSTAGRNNHDPKQMTGYNFPCVEDKCAWWVKRHISDGSNEDRDVYECAVKNIAEKIHK